MLFLSSLYSGVMRNALRSNINAKRFKVRHQIYTENKYITISYNVFTLYRMKRRCSCWIYRSLEFG